MGKTLTRVSEPAICPWDIASYLLWLRTFLKDLVIFILEEARFSENPFTKAQIQEGLVAIMEDWSTIVIAHRS